MTLVLKKSVGAGGMNVPVDVLTVQASLNRVPADQGGPLPLLATDAAVGPNTVGAISRFQRRQFGWADGRIDPNRATHRKLDEVLAALPPAGPGLFDAANRAAVLGRIQEVLAKTPAAALATAGYLATLSPTRLIAIDVALHEATPYPGRVSDRQTTRANDPWDGKVKQIRLGWPRLREYFDVACPAFLRMDKEEHREGILCWNKRVQAPGLLQLAGTTPGVHWCGIFTTWVYKAVQSRQPDRLRRPLRWQFPLISMPFTTALSQKGGKLDLQPGDVGVILSRTHHFVVISPPENGKVWIVSGNDEYQSILVKTMAVKDILMMYSADHLFL